MGKICHVNKQIYEEKLYVKNELFDSEYSFTLDSLGSGQKQVLALLCEIMLAKKEGVSIITIDELELHLYPALLKNVLFYLMEQSKELQFFITTHSNIVISTNFNQKVFSIRKINGATHIEEMLSKQEYYDVFNELGIKASDILQSNGVIWVEGPSDAVILKDWLCKLGLEPQSLEYISFVWYGGKIGTRLNFSELLILNPNTVLIQDSDLTGPNDRIEQSKKKIEKQCLENNIYCWTTEKREIENYFSEKSLEIFFRAHTRIERKSKSKLNHFTNIEDIVPNYQKHKIDYGLELASYTTKDEINNDIELKREIKKIIELIKSWCS